LGNWVKIVVLIVICLIPLFIIPAFADEDTIISIIIIGESEFYLDSDNKLFRAKVVIENFDPAGDGYYFMRVSDSLGNVVKETEILPKYKGNQIWGTEIAHIITNEVPETFQILIYTEFGTATATATISLLETKPNVQQAVKEEADESEIILELTPESEPIVEPEQAVPEPTITEEIKKDTSVFDEPITSAEDFDRRSAECETYECQQAQMYAKQRYLKETGQYVDPFTEGIRKQNQEARQAEYETKIAMLTWAFILIPVIIVGIVAAVIIKKVAKRKKVATLEYGKPERKVKEQKDQSRWEGI